MDSSTKVEDTEKHSAANKKKTNSYRPFRKTKNEKSIIETTKFVGMCTALSEYFYDCSGAGQAEQYTKTTEKIAEYVGSEYTMGSNIRTSIDTLNNEDIFKRIVGYQDGSRTQRKTRPPPRQFQH